METLPEEVISRILQFLSVSERKEAALVNKKMYTASLHPLLQKDLIVRCKPKTADGLPKIGVNGRKLTHLEFGEYDGQQISEEALLSLLRECPSLELLDLSGCNSLFLSGRLLSKESDAKILRHNLASVKVLKLNRLKHMTDITFERLISVMDNLEQISLVSVHMIFGAGLYKVNQCSPAMLHFSTFLKFVQWRADKLKYIDLSHTSINDEAVGCLAMIHNLSLDAVYLRGCLKMSDKGLKSLVSYQHSLKILDVSECKDIGIGPDLFRLLENNLPFLDTLLMRKCVNIGQTDVPCLSSFQYLRTLDMGEVPRFLDKDLIKGLCCPSMSLTSLFLPHCPDVSDEFVVQLCKTNCNLIDLDLSSCAKLTDVSIHSITRSLTSLQTLRLSCCREISDVGILGYIPKEGVVPRFTFDFDHDSCPCCRERDSTVFRKPLGTIQDHKSCMSKAHLSVMNGEVMYMLSNMKTLQVLDLSYCPRITDLALAEALRFKDLHTLSLVGLPRIHDSAIHAITRNNPSLVSVNLSQCALISDTPVVELILHCPQLSSLDVSKCAGLTDGLLKGIAANGKTLKHLDISFNNMSLKAVSQLQSFLPGTRIVFKPQMD